MLDKQDIALLKGMFETYKKDTIAEMRDEMHSLIAASEQRVETEILAGVAEMLDLSILPQIDSHERAIAHIKAHLKLA